MRLKDLEGTNNTEVAMVTGGKAPVPEPGSLPLFGSGILVLGAFVRRRCYDLWKPACAASPENRGRPQSRWKLSGDTSTRLG